MSKQYKSGTIAEIKTDGDWGYLVFNRAKPKEGQNPTFIIKLPAASALGMKIGATFGCAIDEEKEQTFTKGPQKDQKYDLYTSTWKSQKTNDVTEVDKEGQPTEAISETLSDDFDETFHEIVNSCMLRMRATKFFPLVQRIVGSELTMDTYCTFIGDNIDDIIGINIKNEVLMAKEIGELINGRDDLRIFNHEML